MNRSAGVTVIAVLTILGSLGMILGGLFMLLAMAVSPIPPGSNISPAAFRGTFVVLSLLHFGPAAWGIITSIGLFRLRNWARVSTIVFSVLLLAGGVVAALVVLMTFSPSFQMGARRPEVVPLTRITMGIAWLLQVGLGSWWLVFFNNSRVKAQFLPARMPTDLYSPFGTQPAYATPYPSYAPYVPLTPVSVAEKPAGRPVSITIIAVLQFLGAAYLIYSIVTHAPAVLFLKILTGWPATVYYGCTFAIHLYLGIELLRLRPLARMVAIGYYAFGVMHSAVFFLVPGLSGRVRTLIDLQHARRPGQPPVLFDMTPFIIGAGILGLAVAAAILYFLLTSKPAFERKAESLT